MRSVPQATWPTYLGISCNGYLLIGSCAHLQFQGLVPEKGQACKGCGTTQTLDFKHTLCKYSPNYAHDTPHLLQYAPKGQWYIMYYVGKHNESEN
eukprot:1689737-Amphidinium_carterae.1